MSRKSSQLILNENGSIYHLHLRKEEMAPWIITVGDPGRVKHVSKYLDDRHFSRQNREFISCRGRLGNKELLIISTGIGPDNIDIVLNELDALANINFESGEVNAELQHLTFIRIGTTGALQPEICVDTQLVSAYALGLDNMMVFYEKNHSGEEKDIAESLSDYLETRDLNLPINLHSSDEKLLEQLPGHLPTGITLTCPGFYGPQGRQLRLPPRYPKMLDILSEWSYGDQISIANLEMETAAILGLSTEMGHRAISFNAVLANRKRETFSKQPKKSVEQLIESTLEWIDGLPDQD